MLGRQLLHKQEVTTRSVPWFTCVSLAVRLAASVNPSILLYNFSVYNEATYIAKLEH